MRRRIVLLLLGAGMPLLLTCGDTLTQILISDEEEVQMGQNFAAEIESDTANFPLYRDKTGADPALIRYIDSIGQVIARSQKDRDDISYHFTIVDQDTVINAFAVPGGFIYVYTGLIRSARNEAEIAGVLAHEIGHVTKRHGAKQLLENATTSFVLDLIVGDSTTLRSVLDVAGGFLFLKYSRDNEYQADSCSVEYLIRAGYNPNGMKTFLEFLESQNTTSWGIEVFSTHPETDKRVDSVATLIATKSPSVTQIPVPPNPYYNP
jgi:predicted Zn-dependent protease